MAISRMNLDCWHRNPPHLAIRVAVTHFVHLSALNQLRAFQAKPNIIDDLPGF